MGLGQRGARRHDTAGVQREAGVNSELWWDFKPNQHVMTIDGIGGVVTAVLDGPHPGSEAYEVTLDNGLGGGQYTASQLREADRTVASVDHTAADDYPELGTILSDRPDPALQYNAAKGGGNPFEFRHEETDTGGTKFPRRVDTTAHHPDSGEEAGRVRYFPPKRRGGPISIDEVKGHAPGAASAMLNEIEDRHPGSSMKFLHEVKRNNNNPDKTGHELKGAGQPSDWDTHYPNLAPTVHRGLSLRLPSYSARTVNSSANTKDEHLAELHSAIAQGAAGTHWTENEHAARLFAHNAVSDHRTDIPVVLHASTPARKDIETRHDHLYRGGVFPYGDAHSSENEVPVRKGRKVAITGISWRPDAAHPDADEDGWMHHTYSEAQHHTAALAEGGEDAAGSAGDPVESPKVGEASDPTGEATPSSCSYCGGANFTDLTDNGRSAQATCATCGGTMSSWGGQWTPELIGDPSNHPRTWADPSSGSNSSNGAAADSLVRDQSRLGAIPAGPCEACKGTGKVKHWEENPHATDEDADDAYIQVEHECDDCDGKGSFSEISDKELAAQQKAREDYTRTRVIEHVNRAHANGNLHEPTYDEVRKCPPWCPVGERFSRQRDLRRQGSKTLSWDEIGDRHPHVYGDSDIHGDAADGADGPGIGAAAHYLAHERPGHLDAEDHSVHELDFHPMTVHPRHIDYSPSGVNDDRVTRARQGYMENPDKVPPLVLVKRHNVYQVADGHHRAEAAHGLDMPVRAYVAHSPYPDEPFHDGEKAPFHGAKPTSKTGSLAGHDWCTWRREARCTFPGDSTAVSLAIPQDRGPCPWDTAWQQQVCPISEPGPMALMQAKGAIAAGKCESCKGRGYYEENEPKPGATDGDDPDSYHIVRHECDDCDGKGHVSTISDEEIAAAQQAHQDRMNRDVADHMREKHSGDKAKPIFENIRGCGPRCPVGQEFDRLRRRGASDADHRLMHQAPDADYGAPAHDLTGNGIFPEDVYTHPHYYDTGHDDYHNVHSTLSRARGNPEKKIRIYRSLPGAHAHKGFHPGDWVTTSKAYARDHGRQYGKDSKHDWPVISASVPAKHLHTEGDLMEFAYNGDHKPGNVAFKGGHHEEVSQRADGSIAPVKRRATAPFKERENALKEQGYSFSHYPPRGGDSAHAVAAFDSDDNNAGYLRVDANGDRMLEVEPGHEHAPIAEHMQAIIDRHNENEKKRQGSLDSEDLIRLARKDADLRFHFIASWADVRAKAKRIRAEGGVRIAVASNDGIAGEVKGDHNIYETALTFIPASRKVGTWNCGCRWAAFAWGRSPAYQRFEGRMCSHALAMQFEAQSRGMFGRVVSEDVTRPSWLKQHTPVVIQNDRDTNKNRTRRAVPPGNMRTVFEGFRARVQAAAGNVDPLESHAEIVMRRNKALSESGWNVISSRPVTVLAKELLGKDEDPADIMKILMTFGLQHSGAKLVLDTALGRVAEKEHPTLYRGIHLGLLHPDEVHEMHANPSAYFSKHTDKQVGSHWTPDINVAHGFALGEDDEDYRDEDPDDEEYGHHPAGMIMHAKVHPEHIIDPYSEEGENFRAFAGAFDHNHPEQERSVRPGAPVHISHVSAVSYDPIANDHRDTTVKHGVHHTAAKTHMCPKCGHEVGEDARTCPQCGAELPPDDPEMHLGSLQVEAEEKRCPHCGGFIGPQAFKEGHCNHCGHPLAGKHAAAKPDEPLYLRFGHWPESERSHNNVTGYQEEGVSVYDLNHHGEPKDPDTDLSRWHEHDEHCEPDCDLDEDNNDFGNDTREEMDGRIRRAERNRHNGQDRPSETGHLVKGEMVGIGHDGEPLLRKVKRVGDWIDHKHLFFPGAEPHRLARGEYDEDYEPPKIQHHAAETKHKKKHNRTQDTRKHAPQFGYGVPGWGLPLIWCSQCQGGGCGHCGGGGQVVPAPPSSPSTTMDPIPDESVDAGPVSTGNITETASLRTAAQEDGPTVSGVCLKAADSGRVLMLQRSLDDEDDPAAGTWEFPGGHHEEGDLTSLHAGIREWQEEVGQSFPEGGVVHHSWSSPNGVYRGHTILIPSEKDLRMCDGRVIPNPDDPKGDGHEQAAWWDIEHARKNPALREELKTGTPWKEIAKAGTEKTAKKSLGDSVEYREGKTWKGNSNVTAHLPSGERIGELGWHPEKKHITWVAVYDDEHRRQGVASGMLAKAREMDPEVHHNDLNDPEAFTDAGRAWAQHTGAAWDSLSGMDPQPGRGVEEPLHSNSKNPASTGFATSQDPASWDELGELSSSSLSPINAYDAMLHDEPEGALPSTDGAAEEDESSLYEVPDTHSEISAVDGSMTPNQFTGAAGVSDIVARFQATAAASALMSGGSAAGESGGDVSFDIAAAARAHLAANGNAGLQKSALKEFNFAEQQELINEGKTTAARARNFGDLQIEGTHYEHIQAALSLEEDPEDLFA